MTITINATGAERKRLVQTIARWLGCEAKYLGVPSCAYQVDYFTIEKNGSLTFDDSADSEVIERLLQHIYDEGFDIDQSHTEDEPEDEKSGIYISMPRSIFKSSLLRPTMYSLSPVWGTKLPSGITYSPSCSAAQNSTSAMRLRLKVLSGTPARASLAET